MYKNNQTCKCILFTIKKLILMYFNDIRYMYISLFPCSFLEVVDNTESLSLFCSKFYLLLFLPELPKNLPIVPRSSPRIPLLFF